MRLKLGIYLLGLLSLSKALPAQNDLLLNTTNAGFSVGAHFALGSHFQRLGLSINAFYVNSSFQFNAEARAYFSAKNLGPHLFYTEAVMALGVVYGFGKKEVYSNPFLHSASNQTGKQYALAYAYQTYWNKIRTTQQTGIIALQFNKIQFITENDLFAKPSLDRFRTGAFLIQYRYEDLMQLGVNATLWTGKLGFPVRTDKNYPGAGYMDTTGNVYGNTSHGLLSAQALFNLGNGQSIRGNLGVDAEKVRHVIQNRLIHDVCWLPKKWFPRKNCHIAMLDEKGQLYLFKKEQRIRPSRLYWNVFSNPSLFY